LKDGNDDGQWAHILLPSASHFSLCVILHLLRLV
jgi:hypothetical protein